MNQDQEELQKFNAMASDWWNPEGCFRALHAMNPIRLAWIESFVSLSTKKVLDIGCGGGILAEALAGSGAEVTAIDLAEKALAVAGSHAADAQLDINYRCIPAEKLAKEQPDTYDVITCMELLEHVPAPDSIINACSTLLKPSGYVFFATLNRNLKSLCHAIIGAEYLLNLLPPGTHDFDRFIKPAELCRYARQQGLTVKAITGITCDLNARHFRLTENTAVNYMVACQKP